MYAVAPSFTLAMAIYVWNFGVQMNSFFVFRTVRGDRAYIFVPRLRLVRSIRVHFVCFEVLSYNRIARSAPKEVRGRFVW